MIKGQDSKITHRNTHQKHEKNQRTTRKLQIPEKEKYRITEEEHTYRENGTNKTRMETRSRHVKTTEQLKRRKATKTTKGNAKRQIGN